MDTDLDKLQYELSYDLDGHMLIDIADDHYKVQLTLNKDEVTVFKKKFEAILDLMIKHESILKQETK